MEKTIFHNSQLKQIEHIFNETRIEVENTFNGNKSQTQAKTQWHYAHIDQIKTKAATQNQKPLHIKKKYIFETYMYKTKANTRCRSCFQVKK